MKAIQQWQYLGMNAPYVVARFNNDALVLPSRTRPLRGLRSLCIALWLVAMLCAVYLAPTALAEESAPTLADRYETIIQEGERLDGFIPLHWHAQTGKLYAQLTDFKSPFIYYASLAQGVGSNDLGLDRGQLGDTFLVQFERVGPKVLLVALNTRYRANSDNAAERRAVEEAFAQSVLWGFTVSGESQGKVLVDITDFALSDAVQLGSRLAAMQEGAFRVSADRSLINPARTKGFPDNTEIDALVTYTGQAEGRYLPTVSPSNTSVSVHIHHSFVRLPEPGYEPLPYDPRAGFIDGGQAFMDYAAPLGKPVKRAYAWRHRLEKKNPNAAMSEAVNPIVYYVDPGTPEPIRSALIEGASWWNQAFEEAGFINGFQVKLLPEGADPMDVRYNVIQWVHRSTRGWSYGSSIRDPRTQEILKGHVTLGSLRARQDYMIAEGLLAPYGDSDEAQSRAQKQLEAFALARIRQLSAHEVGHTIGLAHNFAASTNDRASVMDYPYPLVTLNSQGEVDVSEAYAVGIGEWDKRAITWGYSHFPKGTNEAAARNAIMADTIAAGLSYVEGKHARADSFARSGGACHSRGALWDNGADPVAELNRLSALRRVVLDRFSPAVIQRGEPLSRIEEVLVPAYLMHRYQLKAAGTVLGGRDFVYTLKGDGQMPTTEVAPARQQAALNALLDTLSPEFLALPLSLIEAIPPAPPLTGNTREQFPRDTGYLFDPVATASASAELSLQVLLDPTRAARLNRQRIFNVKQMDFAAVLERLMVATWQSKPATDAYVGQLQQRVQQLVVNKLASLMGNPMADTAVRSQAFEALSALHSWITDALGSSSGIDSWQAHYRFSAARIDALMNDDTVFRVLPVVVPPGSPI